MSVISGIDLEISQRVRQYVDSVTTLILKHICIEGDKTGKIEEKHTRMILDAASKFLTPIAEGTPYSTAYDVRELVNNCLEQKLNHSIRDTFAGVYAIIKFLYNGQPRHAIHSQIELCQMMDAALKRVKEADLLGTNSDSISFVAMVIEALKKGDMGFYEDTDDLHNLGSVVFQR